MNESKLDIFFFSYRQKAQHFLVCHRILVISLCVPWDEKVENQWAGGSTGRDGIPRVHLVEVGQERGFQLGLGPWTKRLPNGS